MTQFNGRRSVDCMNVRFWQLRGIGILNLQKQFVRFNFVNFLFAIAGREHGFHKG